MPNMIDPRKILPGKNGKLFTGDGVFMAEVPTYQVQININNSDYQPAGSFLVVAIMMGYTVALTFTETVVKDATVFKKVMEDLKAGKQPSLDFQGVITGHDNTENREIFRSCVPDGAIDLQSINVGDIISRAWSFRVNEAPDMQSYLGETA